MSYEKERVLNTDEAARYLSERTGLTIRAGTMACWRFDNRGPRYRKVGGFVRYAVEDLDAFIAKTLVRIETKTRVRVPRQATA